MTTSIPVFGRVASDCLDSMGKCIYCGGTREAHLRMTIRTPYKEKLKLRVPYCMRHFHEAKRNMALDRVCTGIGVLVALAICVPVVVLLQPFWPEDEDSILRDIMGWILVIFGLLAAAAIAVLVKSGLSVLARSLKDTPGSYLGFDASLAGGTLTFSFVNDRIAREFAYSLPPPTHTPPLDPTPAAPAGPRAASSSPPREGKFRTFVIVVLSCILCVIVLAFLVATLHY